MNRFLILNGPNINMLGRRDRAIYGSKTLDEINGQLAELADSLGVEVVFYQSNAEGNLVDCIQEHWGKIQGPGTNTTDLIASRYRPFGSPTVGAMYPPSPNSFQA